MKSKMKEVVTFKEVFVSKDGREFNTEADCRKWEDSYACTMEESFAPIKKTTAEATELGITEFDAETYILKPSTLDEIAIINAYADGIAYEVGNHLGAHHIGKVIALVMSYGREYARFIDLAEHIESIVKYLDKKVIEIEKGAN